MFCLFGFCFFFFNISVYPFVKCGGMVPRVKFYMDGLLQMWVGDGWGIEVDRRLWNVGHASLQ